jgi:hypothetical protein
MFAEPRDRSDASLRSVVVNVTDAFAGAHAGETSAAKGRVGLAVAAGPRAAAAQVRIASRIAAGERGRWARGVIAIGSIRREGLFARP